MKKYLLLVLLFVGCATAKHPEHISGTVIVSLKNGGVDTLKFDLPANNDIIYTSRYLKWIQINTGIDSNSFFISKIYDQAS